MAPRYSEMCKIKATSTSPRKAQKHLATYTTDTFTKYGMQWENFFNHIFVNHISLGGLLLVS